MLKTWVVNMDYNPHRMEFMKKQLDAFGIPFERFSGIVGADYFEKGGATLRKVFSPVRSLIALRKKMTAGQLGDTLSHLAIYHKMIDGNIPAALIFEDDGILAPFFPDQVRDVEKFMDTNKPQVFLFDGYGTDINEKTPPGIRPAKNAWCTEAYICTLAAAKLLVAKNEPVLVICDSWKRFRRWFGLEIYHVVPLACTQADFKSDIPVREKVGYWLLRQVFWIVDFFLIKITGR